MFEIRQRSCLPTALLVGLLQESCPESPDPKLSISGWSWSMWGRNVSGFGICETKLRIATTDTLKQFNGSRKDLVCKKALRKKDVLQAVDGRCQRTSLAALGELGCVESGVGSHAKSRLREANGGRLEGHWQHWQRNWCPPHYFANRPGPFALHGLRLVPTVSKGLSNGGWLELREWN
jgi:hypothetical protein